MGFGVGFEVNNNIRIWFAEYRSGGEFVKDVEEGRMTFDRFLKRDIADGHDFFFGLAGSQFSFGHLVEDFLEVVFGQLHLRSFDFGEEECGRF